MSDAFVIETARHTAGIAVRERSGYRFYAAHRLFEGIDNRKFRDLADIRAVVDRRSAEASPRRVHRTRAKAATLPAAATEPRTGHPSLAAPGIGLKRDTGG